MKAIDVHGFAGGMTLGVVQAGWELIGKREGPGGFGVDLMEANRHLYGDGWQAEAVPPEEWTPDTRADLVFGNPPCSGFSGLSPKSFRLKENVNHCMSDLVRFAATCQPETVIFESVQGAFRQGMPFMRALRAELEQLTGDTWGLWHVLHSAASVGAHAIRNRYFWVASKHPFGVDVPDPLEVWSTNRILRDLEGVPLDGSVEGHVDLNFCAGIKRVNDLAAAVGDRWLAGENLQQAAAKLDSEYPESWYRTDGSLRLGVLTKPSGYSPNRLKGHKPPPVMSGGALSQRIHPNLDRLITPRECARILGFPDDFVLAPMLKGTSRLGYLGKGITVGVGRWIGQAAQNSLHGRPGTITGEPFGENEWLINVTHDWKKKGVIVP